MAELKTGLRMSDADREIRLQAGVRKEGADGGVK